MDPVSLIITALVAGATVAAKETAEKAIKDAYQGLKTLIKKKFEGDSFAQGLVDGNPEDIKQVENLLEGKIRKAAVHEEPKIIEAAQNLLDKVEEQPGGQQIITNITQNISNVKIAAISGSGDVSISNITEHGTSKQD
ncbi:hypothetical protein MEN41_08070 [Dolichospermum sp. ST_con]|nr:hypothetical protein [Dolichospermum sp. ST_con]MDD1418498.1 hypothetical protein [Dolichospermum sp. ST_sed1]MDD1425470.1 hypothetical protein [Dolichospermum sp. ST_sed9]MDD1432039.1 hypothetical protein [Dolichospermum sp. ST_sed6]MDD1441427.1 hypothetical protein [Dolichospermum sp. ST_sed3]MDD1447220.1 hypothetical protein [Dolichospermum sp. ST_sed8]MDD1455540.1 hypothetical protein [Dolichospermum sp. ST_sed7]MDD1461366.1 hypothetical protein [Dolichospermum sp. ST_sed2]MDD1467563